MSKTYVAFTERLEEELESELTIVRSKCEQLREKMHQIE
jgi:hypothetical protein